MLNQGKTALSEADMNSTFSFSHTCSLTLPDDAKLIVLIQRMDEVYDDTTCKIYNVTEINLNQ